MSKLHHSNHIQETWLVSIRENNKEVALMLFKVIMKGFNILLDLALRVKVDYAIVRV